MSFFIKKKVDRERTNGTVRVNKRKGADDKTTTTVKTKRKPTIQKDEEISSDSEKESDGERGKKREEENDLELEETAQEKKLRLTKLYLEQLRTEEEDKADDRAFRHDVIADRLQDELMEQSGTLQRQIAKELRLPEPGSVRVLRGHQLPVMCLVVSPDSKHLFSASKDCTLIKWDVESGRRVLSVPGVKKKDKGTREGHAEQVLCMAISSDGKCLATGDKETLILLWNPATMQLLHTFKGHRNAVSGLCFRKGTHQLYSASHDRSVKVWNVDERAYVETLFGHQDAITALDCLARERCVTAGGRDRSVRVWKILEESQLVFHGHSGSIDCVQLINEEHMVSGADDGSLALWGLHKKRPLATVQQAHGMLGEPGLEQPQWITSVAAMLNSDVVASGSHDGHVRLWKCGANFKSLEPLFAVPLSGFINALAFSSCGSFLVAGVGQEHRLGRWWRLKEAKNSICIIPLVREAAHDTDGVAAVATAPAKPTT